MILCLSFPIYGVPGHAKNVLKIDTKTDEMELLFPADEKTKGAFDKEYKWLRGVSSGWGGGGH